MNSCTNTNPGLPVRPLEDKKHKRLYSNLKSDEELIPDIIFDEDRIRDTCLDKYDGVQAEILQVTRFDESTLCKYFNKFINTLKKEREQKELKENYPWLDPSDERKYMTDK